MAQLAALLRKGSEDQPRDEKGRWTSGNTAAVKEYQNALYGSSVGGFTNIQGVLRDGVPKYPAAWNEEKGREHIANLKDAFEQSALTAPITVYRGVRVERGGDQSLLGLKVGDSFADKGVTSTSRDKSVVSSKFSTALNRSDTIVRIEMELPVGTKAIDVDRVAGKSGEKEIAVAPGTKFSVTGRRESGGVVYLKMRAEPVEKMAKNVDAAAHSAATSDLNLLRKPTAGQARAGNYKKGRTRVAGLDVTIENPAGSRRRPEWPALSAHYGYVRRTVGADGDHVDVFVRPGTPADWKGSVYVVDQLDASGKFDEHKCMVGYDDERSAVQAYRANYTRDWRVGPVTPMTVDAFSRWLREGDTTKPASGRTALARLLTAKEKA